MQSKDVSCQADYWDFLWPERRFKPKQETNSEIMSQVKRFISLQNSLGKKYDLSYLNLSKLPVISDLRSEILSYECECRYWFNENTHLHRQCNYITRQNIIQKRQYEVLRKRNEFLSTKIKDQD